MEELDRRGRMLGGEMVRRREEKERSAGRGEERRWEGRGGMLEREGGIFEYGSDID